MSNVRRKGDARNGAENFRLKSCLQTSDFKTVNRTVTSPMSLIPGTLLLAVILLAQKVIALLGF